jgi:ATP-dependent DNA ligase
MQPVDAAHDRAWYINDPAYAGQPKRNGHRMVVWAVPEAVAWQARGRDGPGLVKASPSRLLDECLRLTAQEIGPFLLDGEIVWLDVAGLEHRTAPQAATANLALGQPEAVTLPTYAVFEALYAEGSDLTSYSMRSRFNAGYVVAQNLHYGYTGRTLFEFLEPVYTREAKQVLADRQVAEGREGEVWRLTSAPYSDGKQPNGRGQLEPMVRTKYNIHPVVRVTGFSRSGAVKVERRFAAIQVADPVTGAKMGSVGTGFAIPQQDELLAAFADAEAQGRPLLIKVTAADLTESGILYQGRYDGIVRV